MHTYFAWEIQIASLNIDLIAERKRKKKVDGNPIRGEKRE